MQGELRWGWNKGDCVGWSLNCLIDPHHSCARHMSPVFPKRKFCEAQIDDAGCTETRLGAAEGSFYLSDILLCGCVSCKVLGEKRGKQPLFVLTAIAGDLGDFRVGPRESKPCQNQVGRGSREPTDSLLLL